MRNGVAALIVMAAMAGAPAGAVAQAGTGSASRDLNLTAYSNLLWSDVRAQKVAVLTELMALTEEEAGAFWPVYRAYDAELARLQDERASNVGQYADHHAALSDSLADSLGRTALDISRRRVALLESYYGKMRAAVSPRVALRFLQVEHQLQLVLDLQIAASLPVVK